MIRKLSTPYKVFVTERITLESHTQVAPFRLASLEEQPQKATQKSHTCKLQHTTTNIYNKGNIYLMRYSGKRLSLAAQNKHDFKVGTI